MEGRSTSAPPEIRDAEGSFAKSMRFGKEAMLLCGVDLCLQKRRSGQIPCHKRASREQAVTSMTQLSGNATPPPRDWRWPGGLPLPSNRARPRVL